MTMLPGLDKVRGIALRLGAASFRGRQEGQALIEYSLVLSLVSVSAIGALTVLGASIQTQLPASLGPLAVTRGDIRLAVPYLGSNAPPTYNAPADSSRSSADMKPQ